MFRLSLMFWSSFTPFWVQTVERNRSSVLFWTGSNQPDLPCLALLEDEEAPNHPQNFPQLARLRASERASCMGVFVDVLIQKSGT